MDFDILAWDSHFFKFNVAKIHLNEFCNFNKTFEILKFENVKLAYCSIDVSNIKLNHLIKKIAGENLDTRVCLIHNINPFFNETSLANQYTLTNIDPHLLELTYLSGRWSRFALDPKIARSDFERLYRIWISNSIAKENTDAVLTIVKNDQIVAFVSLNIDQQNKKGKIVLIAVSQAYQGMGLGSMLIHSVKMYLLKHNCFELSVVTQLKNVEAMNLYLKNGFSITEQTNTYHIWL